MITRLLLPVLVSLAAMPIAAADSEGRLRPLFAFDAPEAAAKWQAVNDGVMGGRSDGRLRITPDATLEFFGTLSLENNGGFASVRSTPTPLALRAGDELVLRVRGDGREYSLNLYVPRRQMAFSYRATFKTVPGEWIEVPFPLDRFEATSFGQVVRNQPLVPAEINGVGLLLGDKKPGPFRLEVAMIGVRPASKAQPASQGRGDNPIPADTTRRAE
jgi:monofunctional biosynthetic peptidoglycan transglycosylase